MRRRLHHFVTTTDTDASITQCPLPNGKCLDAKRSENKYGVLCGLSCRLGSYGIAPDQCTSCEKGKYGDRTGTRASVCTLCPCGKVQPCRRRSRPRQLLTMRKGQVRYHGSAPVPPSLPPRSRATLKHRM